MRSLPLYTAENDTAPILEGESWSLATTQPLMGLSGKKQVLKQIGTIGDGCTMCHRHKKRDGDSIVKPRLIRGSDPSAPKLLCVFSYNDYGLTVDRVVEYLRTFHKGHILLDLPVRCGTNTVTEVQLDACRPYLRRSYSAFNPQRIIAFGGRASSAILGVAVPAWQNRWCWTTLPGPTPDAPRIPVVVTMDPTNIAKSRVHAKIIQEEIRWAVEAEFDDTRPTGRVFIPEDESDIPAIDQWVAAAKRKTGWVAHDVETDGVMYNPGFSIIAAGFACSEISHALVWDAKALANPALLKKCIEILTDPELGKRGSNIKYDANSWRAWKGVVITPITGDCRLEMKQANAESSAKLEAMGFYVGINAHKREAKAYMKEAKKLAAEDMDDDIEGVSVYAHVYKYLPPDVMIRYNGLDNYTTARVCEYSRRALGPLVSTLDRLILPASEMYADVEAEGMAVDKGNIEVSKSFLEATIVSLAPKFEKENIDPDKPESIRQWLEKMDIESPILTPTGLASTNAKALGMIHKAIQHKNTIIADILQYRKVAKLLSSYADTLPGYIRGDGRVHPSFLLDGARSGRVSCQSPALQTIPSRGELAKLIKNCFVAKPGYSLVAADFSILEVRVAAILSQDPDMALAAQTDFHTETAKSLAQVAWGMTPEQVEAEILSGDKRKRDASKTLGFAIIYGAGPESVAEKIGCSVRMAVQLIEFFLQRYRRLRAWSRETKAFAREHAMVEIPWLDGSLGRVRPLLDIVSADGEKRGNAERAAVNTPIQGLASDICMSSAVRIQKYYREKNIPANIVCLVHDSIISEVRDDHIEDVVKAKNYYMTDWPTGPVPLKVEIEVGHAWGSMKKVA